MISRRQLDIQTKSVAVDTCGEAHLLNNSPEVCHQVYIKRKFIEEDLSNEESKKSKFSDSTFRPVKSAILRLPAYDGSSLLNFVQKQSKSLAAFVSGITKDTIDNKVQSTNRPIIKDSKLSRCTKTKAGVFDTKSGKKQKCFKSNIGSGTGSVKPLQSGCNSANRNLIETKSNNNNNNNNEFNSLKPSLSSCNYATSALPDIKNCKNKNVAKVKVVNLKKPSSKVMVMNLKKPSSKVMVMNLKKPSSKVMVMNLKKPSSNRFVHGTADLPVNESLKPGFSRDICTPDLSKNDCSKPCNLCATDLRVNDCAKRSLITTYIPKSDMTTSTGENVFKCTHCPGIFSREGDFINHLKIHRIHSMHKPFSCSLCSASFCKQMALKNHMLSHDNKSFKYDHSYASFQSQSSLQRHLLPHDIGKPYNCTICPAKFRSNFSFKHHLLIHSGGVMCNSAQSFDKRSTDEPCLADINHKSDLITETPVHGNAESFNCNSCLASCRNKGLLDSHLHDNHTPSHEKPSAYISRVQLDIESDSIAESESSKICEIAPFNRSLMVSDKVLLNGGSQQNKASFENLTDLVSQPIKSENVLHEEYDSSGQLLPNSGADLVPVIKEEFQNNRIFFIENELHNEYDLSGELQTNSGTDLVSEIKMESQDENDFSSENELHDEYNLSGEPQTNLGTDLVSEIKMEPLDENDFSSENELHNEDDLSGELQANLGADLVCEIKEEVQDESDEIDRLKLTHTSQGSTVIEYDTPSLSCTTENTSESCHSQNGFSDPVKSQPDQFCVFSEGKILSFSSSSFEIRKVTRSDTLNSSQSQTLAKPQSHHTADQMKVRKVSVMLTDLFPNHVRKLGKAHTNNKSCVCIYCTRGQEKLLSPASQLENAEECQGIETHSSVLRSEKHSDGETLKLLRLEKTLPSTEQESGPDFNLKEPSNRKPLKCSICPETFKCHSFLLMHESLMHRASEFNKLNSSTVMPAEKRAYRCEHCPQVFTRQTDLIKHNHHHHHQILHGCHLCPALFKRRHNLKTHLLVHSRENSKQYLKNCVRKPWLPQPLHCTVCAAVFTNKTSLSTHMLVHLFDKSLNQTSMTQ